MAWLLVGAGAIGTAFLTNEVVNFYNHITKPIEKYIEKENKDSHERILEEIRQNDVNRKRNALIKYNKIRTKYNLNEKHGKLITNHSDDICYLIFVNHYHALNEEEAILWAMKVIKMDYFDGEVFNKKNTKVEVIGVNNQYELILDELKEYYVILYCNNQYTLVKNDVEIKFNNKIDLTCW